MNSFTANSDLQTALASLSGVTEVRAEDGRVIGYFSPCDADRARQYAEAASAFDHDEIARRKASGEQGKTTGELLEALEQLK